MVGATSRVCGFDYYVFVILIFLPFYLFPPIFFFSCSIKIPWDSLGAPHVPCLTSFSLFGILIRAGFLPGLPGLLLGPVRFYYLCNLNGDQD